MATNEIIEKLNKLITADDAFSHEKDIVYFLIQLRKLMERDEILSDHKGVKFYCDWVAHPKKSRSHTDVADIYSTIYDDCVRICSGAESNDSDAILSLLQFNNLKRDIAPLAEEYGLTGSPLEDRWIQFTQGLLSVLKDQPLEKPGYGIDEIIITKAEDKEFFIKVTFTNPIVDQGGHSHADLLYGIAYRAKPNSQAASNLL